MEWTPALDDLILKCRNGYWTCDEISSYRLRTVTPNQVRERLTLLDNTIQEFQQRRYPAEAIALQTNLPLKTIKSCLFWLSQYPATPLGPEVPQEEEDGWDGPLYEE